MNGVRAAVTGMLASAVVAGGSLGAEIAIRNTKENEIIQCQKSVGEQAVKACVDEANSHFNFDGTLQLLETLGALGIIVTGIQGFRAVRNEVDLDQQRTQASR